MGKEQKEFVEEEKEKGEKRRKEKGKGKERRERGRKKFPAFGRSKFDSSRTKVSARSAIYVWTPKSWSFDKLHEVEVLSYLSYTLFKCFVNACVGLRP